MLKQSFAVAVTALALSACANHAAPPDMAGAAPAADWHRMATAQDRVRLRDWRDAWIDALSKARTADAKAVAAQGDLFKPDLALAGAMPPPGLYRCRTFKLGSAGTAARDFTQYPWSECRVEDEEGIAALYKTSGSQRPVGLILPDSDTRAVFLGTLVLGDEKTALQYGRDPKRDMAGYVKRVGDSRWRLALPYPHFESLLDVIELVPADKTPN
ncbi:DUF4893 domain-containing protein [Stakelama marina]|uniref:DUF4893 domain-containing protein n=1 Tax=Stakelama marina TaxID=2826939 RepID=A0A8T4IHS7_9SPHN|nr:DUF4893 domain-containing protein [Stakelama marina]MBR0553592.1 DUF4893 domain-containing protein [Stakelama marina]